MPYRPTPDQVQQYRRDGYLMLHQPILPTKSFERLKAYATKKFEQSAAGGSAAQLIDCPHWGDAAVFEWLAADEMLDLVEPLIGPDIGVFASHLLQKPPGVGKRVPWHEDSSYWGEILKPMEVASVTLAIMPSVPDNGCLRVIRGSHTNGYSDYDQLAKPEEQIFPTEIKKNQVDESKAVDMVLQPNEASVHHVRSIHGSNANTGKLHRMVLTVRYFPTHVKFDRESHPYFNQNPFHIFLVRGHDKAGNRYSEPGKTGDVLRGRYGVMDGQPKPTSPPESPETVPLMPYTFDVRRLRRGHAYGNSQVYCILDAKTDLFEAPETQRAGLRDSITQAFFLYGWNVSVLAGSGETFEPVETTFTPLYQESRLRLGDATLSKRFFVPYESNHLRSAHLVLSRVGKTGQIPATVRCRLLLPRGALVSRAEYLGHTYLALVYPDGFTGVLWGSGAIKSLATNERADKLTEAIAEFAWDASIGDDFGLSFAASPHGNAASAVIEPWAKDADSAASHLRRVRTIERESQRAIDRYLRTGRLWTPDALVNRGTLWAKINQLRDYQEYANGVGFSNNPPSDTLVARDTFWFLVATNYYQQSWSRRLLETWFRLGLEPNGKWIEYMAASSKPLFRDDYGLNINDNTPLMMIVSHHYYALSGDRGFLDAAYTSLVASANYILEQRDAGGELNPHRLVWCTSKESYMRGLATWRNCFKDGVISGAVTEINSQCVWALRAVADLADHVGDPANAKRLADAAQDLHQAINQHLTSNTPNNPHYLLMIDPTGKRDDAVTGDLLFPVLCGVADEKKSNAIMEELFGPRFWVTSPSGAAGMRTTRPDQPGSILKAEPGNYGLTGGVWPNLALWAGRAAASVGRPDLLVRGLRGTVLLADREDFDGCNVTPGEFPEYFNGDDLMQRGNFRSTFIHGSYQWAALEGVMGLTPRAGGLSVDPQLPPDWKWAAVENMSYRGFPLSMLAVAQRRTLYTTLHVESPWNQVIVSLHMHGQFRVEADAPIFWMVVPVGDGLEWLAVSDTNTQARLMRREDGRVVAQVGINAGKIVFTPISGAKNAALTQESSR